MTPEQFRRAGEIFHATLALTAEQRPQYLADACGDDEDLRYEVESLLAAHGDAGTFIERPALEQVASDVAAEADSDRNLIGQRIAHYEITAHIGEGGMGEVYQAQDTRLNRPVAIKFLAPSLADESARRRFQQEAKMASALNHPHIVTVHEAGERDGRQYLVTEFIDGGTLADWALAATRTWRQIVDLLVGVGDALATAHAAGILHRDIKPSNILVSKSGYAKLADFGLAKLDDHANLPTVSRTASVKTRPGAIIGTIAYMSPEQASGTPLDARSDIFSFGVVVYELLAGRRPFEGVTDRDLLQSIIHAIPEPLAETIPVELRLLVAKSLEKDPAERYQTMREVVVDLKRLRRQSATKDSAVERAGRTGHTAAALPPRWQRWLPFAAGVLVTSAIAALVVWTLWPTPDSKVVNRFDYEFPISRNIGLPVIALSPDGRRLVYNAQDGLYVREMDSLEARRIPGTEQALTNPFFSPDGRTVGYWDQTTSHLMRIALSGGSPVAICAAENPSGISWEADDTIVFAQADGIHRVQANGGTPELVVPTTGKESFYGPQLLPGGESVLFSVSGTGSWTQGAVVVQSLRNGARKVLVDGATDARYEPPDHLVFAQGDGLFVAHFDPKSQTVIPGVVPLVKGVERTITGPLAHYTVSTEGTLAYLPRRTFSASLVWVDRQGHEEALNMPPRQYAFPRISPDGTEIAVTIVEGDGDVWIWNLSRKTLRQFTFDPGVDAAPVWSPDGQRIAYTSQQGAGPANLFWRSADGSGAATRLTTAPNLQIPIAFSPDGSQLFFADIAASPSVASVSVQSDGLVKTLLKSATGAAVSPNGRWIAYQSGLSGRLEVYVQALADLSGGKYKVSSGGGEGPEWSRDGRELFYLAAPGRVMAVPVEAGDRFRFGNPEVVVNGLYLAPEAARVYDVSPDGQRFLMIKAVTSATNTQRLIVIQNWPEEVTRATPTNALR